MISSMIMLMITVHWSFALGAMLSVKTNWSIPRFILICLLMRYFLLSYGI